MGVVASLMDKLPQAAMKGGAPNAAQGVKDVRRQIAIINSMTKKERRNPGLLDGSRRRRIAAGSGTNVQAVKQLTKQFDQMRKMMKMMASGKMPSPESMLRGQLGARRR
jgi:signal recognition particle subunit SRP54